MRKFIKRWLRITKLERITYENEMRLLWAEQRIITLQQLIAKREKP